MKKYITRLILSYLRYFSKIALNKHKPIIIGITGSYGKSSTKDILYTVIKDYYPTKSIEGNSETGIPLGILGLKVYSLGYETYLKSIFDWLRIILISPFSLNYLKGTKYLIVEMGIDDPHPPKNMEYLLTILKPDIAIFLNAEAVHTMQFEKILNNTEKNTVDKKEKLNLLIQKIANEKVKIITKSDCKVGIYNSDNEYVVNALNVWVKNKKTKLIAFGNVNSDLKFNDYKVNLDGTKFDFTLNKEAIQINFEDYLLPKKFHETLSAVIITAIEIGLTSEQIQKSINKNVSMPKSRASILSGIHKSVIIDSSYNASRTTVEEMLHLLSTLKKQTKRPTAFLFGDMRELGVESGIEHELIAQQLSGVVENVYCVGSITRKYVLNTVDQERDKFNNVRWFESAERAGEYLKQYLPEHSIILVKGSQNNIYLEEAIKYILNNKNDYKKLCRQEEYWLSKKNKIF